MVTANGSRQPWTMLAITLILSRDECARMSRLFAGNSAVVIGPDAVGGQLEPMRLPDRPFDEPRPIRRRRRRASARKPKGRRKR